TMWIQEPIDYDKHALLGVSHWGRKRQQFYGFAVNRESALDVYSKRRIIAVIEPKIVEWHNYKHLDWILVRRDDDKIYKFKEGDFKRLRLQDIEDMLLLLVQGKLSNLTVEEHFAFNVSLRMFTRSIVIQRRLKDLQLGVKSYQKRLNLTKPNMYRSDLKRRDAYTAYSNPRGFIYQNKDKKNRLMRIDKLHKFSDGTLNDVRNALDDRLKGIRMQQTDASSSFNELLDTPIDFSNFIMNRLGVDTLTPELLAGPTYELMRGSCNSLTELEYHLEEVYKATTDQLDWVNPEVNRESALDVYSKRRIIAVIEPKIVEWHNYKHLDWILVRRDDDKIYKFKEGDFKRLRLQDIEDMLLLLVQGKLSNLTVEEHFAFNVSLRMFTRSIVIQWRLEDLQLGVKSYQKRLNLTKPNTYRSDLKRRDAYTAYSNPRGFIYQNKDKKNRLMRIDELHKFSDGTLNDVRNALDDRLKGIRMQYLPTTI
nr:hypothetical protein [Tanacetum cinerariifolium]